ncbi:hypothetical protein Gohar_009646, partial [Gossypium harknessii]|nr:hypothetical protein [Gossypium harknessii]
GVVSNVPLKSQSLKNSLSKILLHFYPLAGQLKDAVTIKCNDEGAFPCSHPFDLGVHLACSIHQLCMRWNRGACSMKYITHIPPPTTWNCMTKRFVFQEHDSIARFEMGRHRSLGDIGRRRNGHVRA